MVCCLLTFSHWYNIPKLTRAISLAVDTLAKSTTVALLESNGILDALAEASLCSAFACNLGNIHPRITCATYLICISAASLTVIHFAQEIRGKHFTLLLTVDMIGVYTSVSSIRLLSTSLYSRRRCSQLEVVFERNSCPLEWGNSPLRFWRRPATNVTAGLHHSALI